MDSDDILAVCFLGTLLLLPLATGLAVTAYIAYSRAKKSLASRTLKDAGIESPSSSLLSNEAEESDFYDTDDETEHNERQAEEEADRFLTFGQLWRKEFKKVWNGRGAKNAMKEREREERKKLAKAVARELERRERRRARKAEGGSGGVVESDGLPPYKQ